MMLVFGSCLKNTFVSQYCFSIIWLVKGWSYGVKFLNVILRGGLEFEVWRIWPHFWCLARFAGFLQFSLRVLVCINNDGGFLDFSVQCILRCSCFGKGSYTLQSR